MDKLRELVGKLHATMRLYSHVGLHEIARQKNANKIHLQSCLKLGTLNALSHYVQDGVGKYGFKEFTQPFQKHKLTNHEGTSVTFQGDG
jgi:hypothetical protein